MLLLALTMARMMVVFRGKPSLRRSPCSLSARLSALRRFDAPA